MIQGYKYLSYEERLKKCGLTTLEKRRSRANLDKINKWSMGLKRLRTAGLVNLPCEATARECISPVSDPIHQSLSNAAMPSPADIAARCPRLASVTDNLSSTSAVNFVSSQPSSWTMSFKETEKGRGPQTAPS